MGGAEAKMMDLAAADVFESKICLFAHGKLETQLQEKQLDYSVVPMPQVIHSFRKDDGFYNAIKLLPTASKFVKNIAIEAAKFDIVVAMSQKAFMLSAMARPLFRKPLIWFMNDLVSTDYFSAFTIRLMTTTARFGASHVILNSQSSHSAWLEYGGKASQSSVLYSGVDETKFDQTDSFEQSTQLLKKSLSKDGFPIVGIFGRISSWKGQHVFLKALSKVEKVQGVVVGDAQFGEDEYKQSLFNLSKELNLESKVTFLGHKTDIVPYMKACDIIVHCSTLAEPFGRVIVEGNMAKKIVIAADAGGPAEIVNHNSTGYLYPPGDYHELSRFIKLCLTHEKTTAVTMQETGYQRAVQYFSSTALINGFVKVARKLNK